MVDSEDSPPPNPQRPSRLEAEVAEILARTEQPASFSDHVRRKAEAAAAPRPSLPAMPSLQQLGPGSYLLGAIGLAVVGAAVNGISPLLGTLFAIASIVSLAMVWVRRTPPGPSGPKMWRGRDLDSGPDGPPWVAALRDRMRRPPRI
jgi:hypothetical protein